MNMVVPSLIVGGIVMPDYAASLGFDQRYADATGGTVFLRMLDGSGIIQSHWKKLVTTATGRGSMPAPFGQLDKAVTHEISCAQHIDIQSLSTTITVPSARRADTGYTPIGYAIVNGIHVATPIVSIVSNVATLASVSGATAYIVRYWPKFMAFIAYETGGDLLSAVSTWSLVAEEA